MAWSTIKSRGLLDSTPIIWEEFGRTIYSQGQLTDQLRATSSAVTRVDVRRRAAGHDLRRNGRLLLQRRQDQSIRDFHATVLHLLGSTISRYVPLQGPTRS